MRNLVFHQLSIISDTQQSANQFEFSPTKNLITAKQNSVGKSTIVKCLLWALGCEPIFDSTWKNLSCWAVVKFSLGEDHYTVCRKGDKFFINDEVSPYDFKSFAYVWSNLVNFDALLASRKKDEIGNFGLETPPPAYYFLPYYIEQKTGWDMPWNGFSNLTQFATWQKTIIKYHTGYLSREHFEFEEQIVNVLSKVNSMKHDVKRVSSAVDVLSEFLPYESNPIEAESLEIASNEIKEKLSYLVTNQEALCSRAAQLTNEYHFYKSQLAIVSNAIGEYEKDYTFSVENILSDTLECPLCGVEHDNSLVQRAEILADKELMIEQRNELKEKVIFSKVELDIVNLNIQNIKEDIKIINQKYFSRESEENDADNEKVISTINFFVRDMTSKQVDGVLQSKTAAIEKYEAEKKLIKKNQTKLQKIKRQKMLNESFMTYLRNGLDALKINDFNLDGIKSPMDYKKFVNNGGGATSTRAILVYYLAVMSMIREYGSTEMAPMIIDTPNQQDQSPENYSKMIDLLKSGIDKNQQLFLCALNNALLPAFIEEGTKVIELDETKILKKELYNFVVSQNNFTTLS